MKFDRIDDEQIHLFLDDGGAIVKLTAADTVREFGLKTRNGRFTARDKGIYRFDVEPNSSTATAYYGSLHFTSDDNAVNIGAGQSSEFWHAGQTRYRLSNAISDEFTQWECYTRPTRAMSQLK